MIFSSTCIVPVVTISLADYADCSFHDEEEILFEALKKLKLLQFSI
jgi:hypothetical protein